MASPAEGLAPQLGDAASDPAQDDGIAGRAGLRVQRHLDKPFHPEACGKALEAARGEQPVGIAARAPEQIHVAFGAFEERRAKLSDKRAVFARGDGESGGQRAWIESHATDDSADRLRRDFQLIAAQGDAGAADQSW